MKSLRRPIRSVTYNFNEQDVEDCSSLDQLRDWWNKIQVDIASMESKIETARQEGSVNPDWLKRIKGALFLQQQLAKIIEGKIISMKSNPPEYCYMEMKFIEVVEKKLDKKTFDKLMKLTMKEIIS